MGAPILDLPEADGLIFSIENSFEWVAANEEKIVDLSIRSRWRNPYFSPQWLRSWWKRLEGHKTPVLLVVKDRYGKLVGFGLLWNAQVFYIPRVCGLLFLMRRITFIHWPRPVVFHFWCKDYKV